MGRAYRWKQCACGCVHRIGEWVLETDVAGEHVSSPKIDLSALITAARAAASYERDDLGSPWCGGCHRTVFDCDKEPAKHYGGDTPASTVESIGHSYRPDEQLCPGYRLRQALKETS